MFFRSSAARSEISTNARVLALVACLGWVAMGNRMVEIRSYIVPRSILCLQEFK